MFHHLSKSWLFKIYIFMVSVSLEVSSFSRACLCYICGCFRAGYMSLVYSAEACTVYYFLQLWALAESTLCSGLLHNYYSPFFCPWALRLTVWCRTWLSMCNRGVITMVSATTTVLKAAILPSYHISMSASVVFHKERFSPHNVKLIWHEAFMPREGYHRADINRNFCLLKRCQAPASKSRANKKILPLSDCMQPCREHCSTAWSDHGGKPAWMICSAPSAGNNWVNEAIDLKDFSDLGFTLLFFGVKVCVIWENVMHK